MKRLFVAVPLPEELKQKISFLQQQLRETGAKFNFVSLTNLHFTLKFLGDVEENKIPKIITFIQEIAAAEQPLEVMIQGLGAFPSLEKMNVVWVRLKNPHLVLFMKKINSSLDSIRPEEKEEVPHLTLARMNSGYNKEIVQDVLRKMVDFSVGTFRMDKIVLYESVLTPSGPIYTALKEFNLGNI